MAPASGATMPPQPGLPPQPPGWLCPRCGAANPLSVAFCQYCGFAQAPAAASPMAQSTSRPPWARRGIQIGALAAAVVAAALAGGVCIALGGGGDGGGPAATEPAGSTQASPANGGSPTAGGPAGTGGSPSATQVRRTPERGNSAGETPSAAASASSTGTPTPTRTTAPGSSPNASPSATATATATRTATAAPTATPTPTPTPTPAPTATPTPVPVSIPGTGSWSWRGTLVSNDCPFQPNPSRSGTYRWAETNGDGKLQPGERVNITWAEFGYSDTRTFTYPDFTFSIAITRGSWSGADTHSVTFTANGQVIVNSVVEHYASQPCSVVWAPN